MHRRCRGFHVTHGETDPETGHDVSESHSQDVVVLGFELDS